MGQSGNTSPDPGAARVPEAFWQPRYTGEEPEASLLSALAEELEISPFLARLLWQRGCRDHASMSAFLSPKLRNLSLPEAWPGLRDAAELLAGKLRSGGQALVWGDYDVDGISATALVLEFLRAHGFAARHHIPNRMEEAYGLSTQAVERLSSEGVDILITVDCGISDVQPVARAKELGLTVIITDHHLPGATLPPADAICNPRLGSSPCPHLAGVGVAFMLMATLNTVLAESGAARVDMRAYLDLVALGTLADVVELTGQNRILAKNGLLIIASGQRPGIAALKAVCNQSATASLEASQVVFMLAPRLNAAGRLGQSETALRLLLAKDRNEAMALALELNNLNTARREEEKLIQLEAVAQAKAQVEQGRMGLVLHNSRWHPGIIGIVASRIVEMFHRPAFILCDDKGAVKGSGRSVAAFDLHAALSSCAELFLAFGGHHQAAGVTMPVEALPLFAERFNDLVLTQLGKQPSKPLVLLDGSLPFAQAADFACLKELELLHPFGPGNPEPVFASPPVRVASVQSRPGGPIITALTHRESSITLRAKSWREEDSIPAAMQGKDVRLAYSPRIDRYNGAASVEIKLRSWLEAGREAGGI